MQIFLFFSLAIAGVAILFALQNTASTPVRFLAWEYQGSLALILLLTLAAGVLIGYLASLPNAIKNQLLLRGQRKKSTEIEAQLATQRTRIEALEKQVADHELPKLEAGDVPTTDTKPSEPEARSRTLYQG